MRRLDPWGLTLSRLLAIMIIHKSCNLLQKLQKFALLWSSRSGKLADDFPLSVRGDGPVAHECRQYMVMTIILAPGLKFFRRAAKLLAKLSEGVSETMGMKVA